jgi:hypothetical protein
MSRRPDAVASAPAAIAAGGNIGSVSSTYIGTQVLGMSAMPVAAAVKDPGSVFTAVGVESFTGREWLAGAVDRFIAASPCGYVFVEAEAGLGKTAFAAWLVRTRGWLSHFSRYAGGRTVRGALQNLSAQLVTGYELDDEAPGGMLADWAQTPGGFENLLRLAAARARQDGKPLTLVVDGLDEAEPSEHGLPFGLPALLPEGAHVVATYRTGFSPGRPDSESVTLRISKTDQRNTSDIASFLCEAVTEDVLAARLAEASTDPARFAAMLAERCDGVWVYLRYVLQEIRLGLRPPGTVSDLPSGLLRYYADQIRHWRQDPAWDDGLLPLLATLGVAGEPLPAAVLARLAGDLSIGSARRWCDFTFRPLLTATRATHAGAPLRYEIYHASFRDLLQAMPGQLHPASDGSYELEALTDVLRQAAGNAHDRIASKYLTDFGSLHTGLATLAQDPAAAARIDDGYALRYLAGHLDCAGRIPELHQLLAATHPDSGGREASVWFTAHDRADCLSSYLNDLTSARHSSIAATRDAMSRHQPAPSLGVEVRYALMAASMTSRAVGISPVLLELLVRNGLWSPGRVLDHARRLTDPSSRYQALLAACQNLDTVERPAILQEALAAAAAIGDEYFCAWALVVLAPQLPPDQRADVLSQALAAATAVSNEDARAGMLAGLAPQLPPDLLGRALAAASAIRSEDARARALAALAPQLPPVLMGGALVAATAISSRTARAGALAGLAPQLPPDQRADVLAQAFAAATAIRSETARAGALAGLAPLVPPDQRADVLAQAFAAATAIRGETARAGALAGLAPLLPPDLLGRALAAADAIRGETARAGALAALAQQLPPNQRADVLAQALAAATAVSNEDARAGMLAGLAPLLPPDLLGRALAAATAIRDESTRAGALAGLAPQLPPVLLGRALAAAIAIRGETARAGALAGLAPQLPPDQRADVLGLALAAAIAISNRIARAGALAGLAPQLPPVLLGRALAAAIAIRDEDARAGALAGLAPQLPADQRADVLGLALAAATAIRSGYTCARALAVLAPQLPPEKRADLMAQALVAAVAIRDETARARMLAELAPQLPPDLLPPALAVATAIRDLGARAGALAGLAPQLPPDQRADVMAQALAVAVAIRDEDARAGALAGLAPQLPPDLLGRALAVATAIRSEDARALVLAGLAPELPPELLDHALVSAPKRNTAAIAAILRRGGSVLSCAGDESLLQLFRASLDGTDRSACLSFIEVMAPCIGEAGGAQAVQECVRAIADVHRQWP